MRGTGGRSVKAPHSDSFHSEATVTMQTIVQKTSSPGSNATISNALEGTDLEFAPRSGRIAVWLSGASAGVNATLRTPTQQIANEASVGGSNNNPPNVRDDVFSSPFFVEDGERVILKLENTTASSVDVYIKAQLV